MIAICCVAGQEMYKQLRNAKFDMSSLNALQMLSHDFKSVRSSSGIQVGVSSITATLESLVGRDDISAAFDEFMATEKLSALVVLAIFFPEGSDSIDRQVRELFNFLCKILAKKCNGCRHYSVEILKMNAVGVGSGKVKFWQSTHTGCLYLFACSPLGFSHRVLLSCQISRQSSSDPRLCVPSVGGRFLQIFVWSAGDCPESSNGQPSSIVRVWSVQVIGRIDLIQSRKSSRFSQTCHTSADQESRSLVGGTKHQIREFTSQWKPPFSYCAIGSRSCWCPFFFLDVTQWMEGAQIALAKCECSSFLAV